MQKSPTRSELRREARRRRLLEAAVRLFARHGYHSTSVPAIVREASSAIGTFYAYFRSKEAVLLMAIEEIDARLSAQMEEVASGEENVLSQIARALGGCLQFLTRNPSHARVLLIEAVGLNRGVEARRRHVLERQAQRIEKAIEAAIKQGVIPKVHAGMAAHACLGGILQVIYEWLETGEPANVALMADSLIEFSLRGISGVPAPKD